MGNGDAALSNATQFTVTVRLEDFDVAGMSPEDQLALYLGFVQRFESDCFPRLFDIRHPEVTS